MIFNIFLFTASFVVIWLGTGLIVGAADRFSKKLRISSFALSFFVLGILTSTPEFAIGVSALSENNPGIFVGNLIGGIPVIFFFIIPLLAILGNGVKLTHQLNTRNLLFSFIVMLAPAFMVMDKRVTIIEGIVLLIIYGMLFFFIQKDKGIFDNNHSQILHIKSYSFVDILKVLLGVGIVLAASHIIVDQTIYFSKAFHIAPFYISLVVLSLGTNLPELSLAIRSVISRKKDVAFGDYVGSAAANAFLFGLFTLLSNGEVVTVNNFLKTFLVMTFGLGLFFYFTRSKHDISRIEGMMLIIVYVIFLFLEGG